MDNSRFMEQILKKPWKIRKIKITFCGCVGTQIVHNRILIMNVLLLFQLVAVQAK